MFAMRTLCIATAFALLAAPAAHAGSIIDSFIGGSGLNLGDCNASHCGISYGKQKFVVRKNDVSSALNGLNIGDRLPLGKSLAKERDRAKATEAAPASRTSDRTAPTDPREDPVIDRSDDRPAPRRQETNAPLPAKDAPAHVDQKADAAVVTPASAPVVADAKAAAEPTAVSEAKSPIGEWVTEGGEGRVRIRACGQALCGVISTAEPNETDRHNPDAAKRNRPLLGTPVLIDMKPVNGKRWQGEIYNAKNGKTYGSNISLKSPDVLRVEGCVFGGFFCGGQDWTRAKDGPQG
jgi:uncharacterized protein (DUF2147 family)